MIDRSKVIWHPDDAKHLIDKRVVAFNYVDDVHDNLEPGVLLEVKEAHKTAFPFKVAINKFDGFNSCDMGTIYFRFIIAEENLAFTASTKDEDCFENYFNDCYGSKKAMGAWFYPRNKYIMAQNQWLKDNDIRFHKTVCRIERPLNIVEEASRLDWFFPDELIGVPLLIVGTASNGGIEVADITDKDYPEITMIYRVPYCILKTNIAVNNTTTEYKYKEYEMKKQDRPFFTRLYTGNEMNELVGSVLVNRHTKAKAVVIKFTPPDENCDNAHVRVGGGSKKDARALFDNWEFEDGSPCGIVMQF